MGAPSLRVEFTREELALLRSSGRSRAWMVGRT